MNLSSFFGGSSTSSSSSGTAGIKTSDYTILANDGFSTIFISGNTTITLPAASVYRMIKFVKTDVSTIAIIQQAGTDTIQGQTSVELNSQYDTVILESDGSTTWFEL